MTRTPRQAPVDYVFWGRLDEWTPTESAALLAGLDTKAANHEPTSKDYVQIRELIERAIRMGDILNHTRPGTILEWARHKGFGISKALQ